MVQLYVIVATQFRCILVTVAKQIKLQKYLFSSLHFKETNNVNAFVIKENSFYSQREYILHYIKISGNVKIPSRFVKSSSFQIGLGDFVPGTGTGMGKDADVDELQANQMKLYVSFLYLLGQNSSLSEVFSYR